MMWGCYKVLVMFAVLTGSSSDVSGQVTMTISPTEAARSPGFNLTVMCKSDRKLKGCNFRVWFTDDASTSKLNRDYPVMDFSQGNKSDGVEAMKYDQVRNDGRGGTVLYNAKYFGKGLEEKECGVVFSPTSQGRYLVGCRGRVETGDWGYEFMSLQVKFGQQEVDRRDPREEIVTTASKNNEATFRHKPKEGHVLRSCTFFLPWDPFIVRVEKLNIRADSSGRYEAQQNDASCIFTLKQLKEQDNGLWWYSATSNSYSVGNYENLYFKIIVITKAPSQDDVVLHLEGNDGSFAVGDELTATCTTSNSRPEGNMTWVLGGDTIRQGDIDVAWRWPWDDVTKQTLKRKLKSEDIGKKLTCQLKHESLKGVIEKTIEIKIKGGETTSAGTTWQRGMTENTTPKKLPKSSETNWTTKTSQPSATTSQPSATTSQPSATTGQPSATTSQPSTTVAGTSTRDGRKFDVVSSTTNATPAEGEGPFFNPTNIAVTACVILTLAILAAVAYARLARRCCFQRPTGVTTAAPIADERQKKAKPATEQAKPSGKPRAPSPGRQVTTVSMKLSRLSGNEAVDYAEIVGAKTSNRQPKESLTENHEDLTYAELAFR